MIRRPPRSTRTDTLFPYTTLYLEDVRLVAGRIMRLVAVAVTAKVRHDHPKTRVGNDAGMAIADPVDERVGEIAVDEEQRPPLPHLAPSQVHAVPGGETLDRNVRRRACQCVQAAF